MSSILNDPRVKPFGTDGHEVTTDNGVFQVLPSEALGWGLYVGPKLDMVFSSGGPVIGFESAEAVIEAVLS